MRTQMGATTKTKEAVAWLVGWLAGQPHWCCSDLYKIFQGLKFTLKKELTIFFFSLFCFFVCLICAPLELV